MTNNPAIPEGARASALTFGQICHLHQAALLIDDPLGALILMATLMPCDADSIAAARIERVDWRGNGLVVEDPRGRTTRVAMSLVATAAAMDQSSSRTSGHLVEYPDGVPLVVDRDVEDYADELVAEASGMPTPFAWSFRALREGVFDRMVDGPVPYGVAVRLAGLGSHDDRSVGSASGRLEEGFTDWWAGELRRSRPNGPIPVRRMTSFVSRLRTAPILQPRSAS